jgi:hypothetical protein
VAVVACDHATGRRRVLRRGGKGYLDGRDRRPALVFGASSADAARAAWVEARFAHGRIVETLWTVDLRRGGRRTHRVVARARDRRDIIWVASRLGAVVLRDGSVSWLTTTAQRRSRLVVGAAPGRRTRVITAGGPLALAVEDGRTVRWRDLLRYDLHYLDVLPLPVVDGCPRRAVFTHQDDTLATPDVLVTYSGFDPFDAYIVRACLRETGRDPVVAQNAEGSITTVAAATGEWILLTHNDATRYDCTNSEAYTLNLRTLREGRRSKEPADLCDGTHAPIVGSSVLTGHGVPAWVATPRGGVPTVFSIAPDGTTLTLDVGTSITDLRVAGNGFAWTTDGIARYAKAT